MPTSDTNTRSDRIDRLAAARLYLVCDSTPGERELSELLPAAIAGGVDIVQLRDKRLDDEQLLTAAHGARELCKRYGALFIVNDRPLIAHECGADGVHVGQDDMPVAQVRELVGPDLLIGLSTHATAEIDAVSAADTGPADTCPDYIGVGPVHATPTKLGRPAVGVGARALRGRPCVCAVVRHRRSERTQRTRGARRRRPQDVRPASNRQCRQP